MNEWSRNLGDAYDWASEEAQKDFDETVENLSQWTDLQKEGLKSIGEQIKAKPPPKPTGMLISSSWFFVYYFK